MSDNKQDISGQCNSAAIPNRTFNTFTGYRRADGRVGTANYWLFIPTVFCENRNLDVIKEALRTELGYTTSYQYSMYTRLLIQAYQDSEKSEALLFNPVDDCNPSRIFKNVDGIKFLNHSGGCGGTRQDAALLSSLLAAYADHPNVGGVTVLSLGCQHLQIQHFLDDLKKRNPAFDKPLYIFEQQQMNSEEELMTSAIRQTFAGLAKIDRQDRELAPISQLSLGITSDSSVTDSSLVYPALGHLSDLMVALGCKVLLTSSREVCFLQKHGTAGAGQCNSAKDTQQLPISDHNQIIQPQVTNEYANWNTGRSARGGHSPVVDLLGYSLPVMLSGLSLVAPSVNESEAITSIVASGATVVLFLTDAQYVKGNPVAPVITISTCPNKLDEADSNCDLDINPVLSGRKTVVQFSEEIFQFCLNVANGTVIPKAVQLMQEDFVPVRTGVSL